MTRDYAATGVDGIGVDTGSDIGAIAAMLPAHVAVQGNLDPLAVVAGGAGDGGRDGRDPGCDARPAVHLQSRAMGSCRRPRRNTWRRCWSRCVPADQPAGRVTPATAAMAPSRPRIAIVLFNLGGPDRPEAIRPFLLNLFRDPAILRVPFFVRPFLARIIARARVAPATANYALLGGKSPLLGLTRAAGRGPGGRPSRTSRPSVSSPCATGTRSVWKRPARSRRGRRMRSCCCRCTRNIRPPRPAVR